jgi:hypothetical protein
MTIGEFEDVVEGFLDRQREARYVSARLESVMLAWGGVKASPLVLLGEHDEFGPNPFEEDDPLAKHIAMRARLDAQAEAEHRAYLPPDMFLDDDEPQEQS